jgi:uncharacterized tellurite resistance protein B-like protein
MLTGEPRLNSLRRRMEEKQLDSVQHLIERIVDIFSPKRPPLRLGEELSSQTRVAAIALLYHIMNIPGQVGREADIAANWILLRCFLLEHEKDLLSKILKDIPTGPRPL